MPRNRSLHSILGYSTGCDGTQRERDGDSGGDDSDDIEGGGPPRRAEPHAQQLLNCQRLGLVGANPSPHLLGRVPAMTLVRALSGKRIGESRISQERIVGKRVQECFESILVLLAQIEPPRLTC